MNLPPAKPRSNSTIDSRLDPDQAELFFEQLENGQSLREGVAWLLAEHQLTLSEMSLSRWAAKRRRAKADLAFATALETLRADRAKAAALLEKSPDQPEDAADLFAEASLLLANYALFTAQRDGEAARIAQAARVATALRNAHTHAQRAENNRRTADAARRRQGYIAAREAILYEHSRGLLDVEEACEEMREVYEQVYPWPTPQGSAEPEDEDDDQNDEISNEEEEEEGETVSVAAEPAGEPVESATRPPNPCHPERSRRTSSCAGPGQIAGEVHRGHTP